MDGGAGRDEGVAEIVRLRAGEVGMALMAGEGRGVVYSGNPGRRLLVSTGVVRLSEDGVGCSLMGVALSVG